jgi:membrane complex biogenesis BtpA family protein
MPQLLQKIFDVPKPVIAMAHVPPLPGTPRYDAAAGVDGLVERVRADLRHLLASGVDAVMFCNEDDRPYVFHADPGSVAVMARVITELRPKDRPFGTDFLWDPAAALALAKATGASFMREVVTGLYESDMGLWAPDAGALYRYRRQLDAQDVAVFANITPEFASPLGSRTVYQRARSAAVSSLVDAILIAGPMAGAEPDLEQLREAKEAVGQGVPVLLNTGARIGNIARFLAVADGVIVGSSLKVDGHTWNPVDPARVQAFMAEVKRVRGR